MLTAYQTSVLALLQAPTSPTPLVSNAVLTTYINTARKQTAADAECIRQPASLALAPLTVVYGFGAISSFGTTTGVASVFAVRSAKIGGSPIDFRPYEWFAQYYRDNGLIGKPLVMAQQGQGSFGTLSFNPSPDQVYAVTLDTACLPVPLVDDTTPEAIPALWTDAVPFYAAWYALMSLQRQADADKMMQRYQEIVRRGRQLATPSELPENLPGGIGAASAGSHQPLATQPPPQR